MSAPTGNTNAQKWTVANTSAVLSQIEELSFKIPINFLGEALDYAGVHRGIWRYWRHIWRSESEIIHRMCLIEQRFENKVLAGAMSGRFHAGIARLHLLCHYGYSEPQATIHSQAGIAVDTPPTRLIESLEDAPPARLITAIEDDTTVSPARTITSAEDDTASPPARTTTSSEDETSTPPARTIASSEDETSTPAMRTIGAAEDETIEHPLSRAS